MNETARTDETLARAIREYLASNLSIEVCVSSQVWYDGNQVINFNISVACEGEVIATASDFVTVSS